MKKIYLIFIALIFMIACNSTPQVIENNTKKEIVKDKCIEYPEGDYFIIKNMKTGAVKQMTFKEWKRVMDFINSK